MLINYLKNNNVVQYHLVLAQSELFNILFQLGTHMMSMITYGALYYLTIGSQLPQTQPFIPQAMKTLINYQM